MSFNINMKFGFFIIEYKKSLYESIIVIIQSSQTYFLL